MLKILKVTLIVLVVTFMVWASLYFKAQDAQHSVRDVPFFKKNFEMIAYKGGSFEAPENTLVAFDNAIKTNPDIILHFNVQMTSDNKAVAFHDEHLTRTTDGRGPVWKATLEEIKKLNAAAKFQNDKGENPFLHQNVSVPTLQEILIRYPNQRFILELGQRYRELAYLVYDTIKEHNAFDRILIFAINNQPLKYLRQIDPRFYLTASQDEVMRMTTLISLKLIGLDPMRADAYFIPTHYASVPVLSDELIAEIHKRGKKVYIQNINDDTTIEVLKQRHVDGVATDRPQQISKQLQ